jgi:hypothetical protein
MLRILTVAGIEHPDTAARLRDGFSTPLHDAVRHRLAEAGIPVATARDATDAIVGGVVYAIQNEGRTFSRDRAESLTRTVLRGVTSG